MELACDLILLMCLKHMQVTLFEYFFVSIAYLKLLKSVGLIAAKNLTIFSPACDFT